KTIGPLDLSPVYPLQRPVLPVGASYLLGGAVVVVITGFVILARRRWPAAGAVWLVYVVTLLPVSGIFQNGPQISADRYSYLPSLSVAMVGGAGLLASWRAWRGPGRSRSIACVMTGAGVLVVTVLVALTWKQVTVWHDPERLWSHALAIAPSSVVHSHLGYVRRQQGRLDEAIEHYRTASSMRPGAADLQIDWGNVLAQQGMLGAAIDRYREALRLMPDGAAPHYH